MSIFVPGTMQLRELSPTPRYSSTNDNIPEYYDDDIL